MDNKRIKYIDVARGIAIILMIVGHVLSPGWKRNLIFSFHMPLFILVSGYFYKNIESKNFVKNIFLKLLIPYIITILVSIIIRDYFIFNSINILKILKDFIYSILMSYSYLKFNVNVMNTSVLWFIPLLICIRILFNVICKITKDDDRYIVVFCILISYIGYLLSKKNIWLPWSIDVAMLSLLFYCFGYMLKKHNLLDKIMQDRKLLIILFIIWILCIKYSSIELAVRKYPDIMYSVIGAISGSLIIIKFSKYINTHLTKCTSFLSWCGKNSIYILLIHYMESKFINYGFVNAYLLNTTISKLIICIIKISITISGAYLIIKLKKIKEVKI